MLVWKHQGWVTKLPDSMATDHHKLSQQRTKQCWQKKEKQTLSWATSRSVRPWLGFECCPMNVRSAGGSTCTPQRTLNTASTSQTAAMPAYYFLFWKCYCHNLVCHATKREHGHALNAGTSPSCLHHNHTNLSLWHDRQTLMLPWQPSPNNARLHDPELRLVLL